MNSSDKIKRPIAPILDLNTIQTSIPSVDPENRHFQLPLAAIYRPSEQEFKNPLLYISSISQEAQKYGIVKIIPPGNWKPPFSLDTRVFFSSELLTFIDLLVSN
jgi:histone demethylase JARID1